LDTTVETATVFEGQRRGKFGDIAESEGEKTYLPGQSVKGFLLSSLELFGGDLRRGNVS